MCVLIIMIYLYIIVFNMFQIFHVYTQQIHVIIHMVYLNKSIFLNDIHSVYYTH